MSNINTFLSKFNNEFARPCNFEVWINIPFILSGASDNETLSFRCESAELPSRTFALTQQKTYGPVSYRPVQSAYDKITLSFICSDYMEEKNFFDKWLYAISPHSNPILPGLGDPFALIGVLFDFEYYDRYITTIEIKQKTLDNKDSYIVKLHEAYPIAVNSMPLSWEAQNTIHKLQVTFAYRYFTERKIQF